MKSTILKLLAIPLLLTVCSCEEEITTPTNVKLNVADTKGRPIKGVIIYFTGYKRKGLLNFLETFSVNSKTDTNGNCAIVGFPFLVQFKNIHNLSVLIMFLTLLGLSVA